MMSWTVSWEEQESEIGAQKGTEAHTGTEAQMKAKYFVFHIFLS